METPLAPKHIRCLEICSWIKPPYGMRTTKITFFYVGNNYTFNQTLKCEQNGLLFPTDNHITMDKNPTLVINCNHFTYKNRKEIWGHNSLFNGNQYHMVQNFYNFQACTITPVFKRVVTLVEISQNVTIPFTTTCDL